MTEAFDFRAAFGCWINDMRNEAMPTENWPYVTLDDRAVHDIVGTLDLAAKAGFNYFDVFGLLVSYSWPVDIKSAVNPERRQRVNQILQAAHERGIKVLAGLGVYSWGFDKIIACDPKVRGPNPHAMCASREESWQWMAKVVDFILGEFAVDGFHLESSDLGRCTCPQCAEQSDVQYHCGLNARTADYIRSKWSDKTLMVNMCGYIQPWAANSVSQEDLQYLIELGNHLDFLLDPGHAGCFMSPAAQREFMRQSKCAFGTSGGTWVYPPQRWERLRWFLPVTQSTGRHIKQLAHWGGRAIEYYMGPTINPGVEVNIAFGGRVLSAPERSCYEILAEVLQELYQPKSAAALDKLVLIFQRAETAYYDNWTPEPESPRAAPGELHLHTLQGDAPQPPDYLAASPRNVLMNAAGRAAYRRELQALLADVARLEGDFADGGRLARIQTCMRNVIADIDAVGQGQ